MKKSITFRYLLFFFIIFIQSCGNQKAGTNKFYNSKFNWTITIPAGFEKLSLRGQSEMQDKGTKAYEKTHGEKIIVRPKMIFVFKNNKKKSSIQSNYQPYDSSSFPTFKDACIYTFNNIYHTLKAQNPNSKIDSIISIEKIDNLKFHKLKLNIKYSDKTTLNIIEYIRLFENNAFTISIIYSDSEEGRKMMNSWRTSKFGKN